MLGRTFSAGSGYRYGFNGKENDNEVKGEGNQQDYGMRIYDNRLGRFLSIDPLTKKYPHYTPYSFAGNTPIQAIDLDGLEEYIVITKLFNDNSVKSVTILYTQTKADANKKVDIRLREVHEGNADGEYLANGQRVLRITQNTNGKDISKKTDTDLTPREEEILKQYSTDDQPVYSDDNEWQQNFKKKHYQSNSEEVERNTSTMKDRTPFVEYNHKTSKTINDVPAIYIADDAQNGNIDFSLNQNFKSAFDGQLSSLRTDGNIGNVQVTMNFYKNSSGGYIEKAKGKIASQMKDYISQKLGIDEKQINIKINNSSGNSGNGNVVISTN